MENNVNGRTSKFGPVTKKLITTSSKDKVNASNHPDMRGVRNMYLAIGVPKEIIE